MEPVLQVLQQSHVLPPRDDVFFDDDEVDVLLKEIHGALIFDVYDDTNPISGACVYDETIPILGVGDGTYLICDEGENANPVDIISDEISANVFIGVHEQEIELIGVHELLESRNTNLFSRSDEDLSNNVCVTVVFDSYDDDPIFDFLLEKYVLRSLLTMRVQSSIPGITKIEAMTYTTQPT
ncbi:unnamed protein product [Microthlaspi erraticum]|uniref:Uncharacterized protein n=1 Tax=Microthlaspi erraticum TaxID=1685480 RepID=A0A6D2JMS3_9BRAS|nr:unnamed protein product [Microthlaspi erraticum]